MLVSSFTEAFSCVPLSVRFRSRAHTRITLEKTVFCYAHGNARKLNNLFSSMCVSSSFSSSCMYTHFAKCVCVCVCECEAHFHHMKILFLFVIVVVVVFISVRRLHITV